MTKFIIHKYICHYKFIQVKLLNTCINMQSWSLHVKYSILTALSNNSFS